MKRIFILTAFIAIASLQLKAQQPTPVQVQQILNSKHYTFEAQTVTPQRGGLNQLTSEYYLKISGDTVISSLPYFGVAYSVPINQSDAGYDFTSTKFDYTISANKKNKYQVNINTKDRTNNTQFFLTIYDNGSAYLDVNSTNRQSISYTGYIKQSK